MYLKWLKIGDVVHRNVPVKEITEAGEEIWNVPQDLDQLKQLVADTFAWLVLQKICEILPSPDKREASTTKAITLLAKVINTLNPDISSLTQKEQEAWQKLQALGQAGYSDSDLLNQSLQALIDTLRWYSQKVQALQEAETLEEVVEVVNSD